MAIIIGSDEALKGDTFGGIVVAAVKADDATRKLLESMGVKDSKTLNDNKIRVLAQRIKATVPVFFISMSPEEFNKEILKYNTTAVLNNLHSKCIETLRSGPETAIVDQYPGCSVPNAKSFTQAESKYVEVAAASIIARAHAVQQIKELSLLAGFELPMGSTHVIDALVKLRNEGKELKKFAKVSFRNVKDIMNTQKLKTF